MLNVFRSTPGEVVSIYLILLLSFPELFLQDTAINKAICIFIILSFSSINIYLGLITCLMIVSMKMKTYKVNEGFNLFKAMKKGFQKAGHAIEKGFKDVGNTIENGFNSNILGKQIHDEAAVYLDQIDDYVHPVTINKPFNDPNINSAIMEMKKNSIDSPKNKDIWEEEKVVEFLKTKFPNVDKDKIENHIYFTIFANVIV